MPTAVKEGQGSWRKKFVNGPRTIPQLAGKTGHAPPATGTNRPQEKEKEATLSAQCLGQHASVPINVVEVLCVVFLLSLFYPLSGWQNSTFCFCLPPPPPSGKSIDALTWQRCSPTNSATGGQRLLSAVLAVVGCNL